MSEIHSDTPSYVALNCCNPYHNRYITVVLDCIVRYQTDEFEIRWFRENLAGVVVGPVTWLP